jgi:hypothetical protein
MKKKVTKKQFLEIKHKNLVINSGNVEYWYQMMEASTRLLNSCLDKDMKKSFVRYTPISTTFTGITVTKKAIRKYPAATAFIIANIKKSNPIKK